MKRSLYFHKALYFSYSFNSGTSVVYFWLWAFPCIFHFLGKIKVFAVVHHALDLATVWHFQSTICYLCRLIAVYPPNVPQRHLSSKPHTFTHLIGQLSCTPLITSLSSVSLSLSRPCFLSRCYIFLPLSYL